MFILIILLSGSISLSSIPPAVKVEFVTGATVLICALHRKVRQAQTSLHSAVFSQYQCHTPVLVCQKHVSCPTNLHAWGYNQSINISTKYCCFSIVRAIHATNIVWQMSHSFGPFQFYLQKILYSCNFSPADCTPRKVIRHMTSDFDVCEIYLDMQTSSLNAGP